MRKLVVLVVVVGLLYTIGELAAQRWAGNRLANRMDSELPGAKTTAMISSFPMVGRLVVDGTVRQVSLRVTGVTDGSLRFRDIKLRILDLRLSRRDFVEHQRLVIEGARRVYVSADVSQASVAHAVGVPLKLGDGTVGIGGVHVHAALHVDGQRVIVTLGSLRVLSLSIPALSVLPCVGGASIHPGVLRLSCTTTTVPQSFLNAVNRAA